MRILLLGATGRTGKLLLEQTLNHGHIVHALVRDKQKVLFDKYNLLLFEGSPVDKEALDKANKAWYANADEISAFLSGANPKWPLGDMKMMMNDHLNLTTDVVVARIMKDYDGDI